MGDQKSKTKKTKTFYRGEKKGDQRGQTMKQEKKVGFILE